MNRKGQIYRQCTLERHLDETSREVDVSWIPVSFARLGKNVSLKNFQDEWIDGWVVVSVGSMMEFDEFDKQRSAQKRWKRVLGHGVRE